MKFKKISLPFRVKKPILALGSQTKNTVCFAKDNFAYLSAIHADLNRPGDLFDFEKTVKYFLKQRPKIIAYDLHPEYQSSRYAQDFLPSAYNLIPIQHHHAHIASCMIDNRLNNRKVIGVAFDGTGLGDDENLWGGEFFLCDYSHYERKAHLKYVPLIGAEQAIWQPWRVAAFWLYLIYKDKLFDSGIGLVKKIDKKKWSMLKKINDSRFNSPLTSSMGRFFDAVASLVFNKIKVRFEAEAAIELEEKAALFIPREIGRRRKQRESYQFKIISHEGKYVIDPAPAIREIVLDLKNGQTREAIAYRFHFTIAEMIKKICLSLRKQTRINEVVLSGGVFQNKVLLRLSLDLLYKQDFRVFAAKELPSGDSAVALGQAAIANFSR
jgi:hydrogenase maturation protein HypF